MNTKRQGDVGIGQAIAHYTAKGYTVCYPLTDASRYDLIVDDGSSLLRVQVKSTRYTNKSGTPTVQLATAGGNQTGAGIVKKINKLDCDLIFVYVLGGKKYEFVSELLDGKANLVLGYKQDGYEV